MKLEYGTKSQEFDASGKEFATKVTLVNSDGAIVPIMLPADKISLSNTELFEKLWRPFIKRISQTVLKMKNSTR